MMKPSEVLAKAADLIAPEGAWTQDDFWRLDDGRTWSEAEDDGVLEDAEPTCFCLFGALSAVRGEIINPEASPTEDVRPYLYRAISLPMSEPLPRLADWNDAEGRTQSEVVAALRAASELAKAEGQ